MSRQNINAVETGKYVPSTVLALRIALIFGKKVEDIFILEDIDWNEGLFSAGFSSKYWGGKCLSQYFF